MNKTYPCGVRMNPRFEKHFTLPVDAAKVAEAETVPCRWCKAPAGMPCAIPGVGQPPAGGFHPSRLVAARKASA